MTPLALIRRALSILLGITFLSLVFLYWPHEVRALNAELGWPVWTHPVARALGVLLITVGVTLFVRCTLLFGRRGSGTPVPTDPPSKLVIEGPFRWSRNPIYVGYVVALVGETLLFGHVALALYAAVCTVAFHLIIVFDEEPRLGRRFGDDYRRYAEEVPPLAGAGPPDRGAVGADRPRGRGVRSGKRRAGSGERGDTLIHHEMYTKAMSRSPGPTNSPFRA